MQVRLIIAALVATSLLAACSLRSESDSRKPARAEQIAPKTDPPSNSISPPHFAASIGSLQTLVAALGRPWTFDNLAAREIVIAGNLRRTTFVQPAGELIVYHSGARVLAFRLQAGGAARCGAIAHLKPALDILVHGLGLPALSNEEEQAIMSAWLNRSAATVQVGHALISAGSNGCVYALSFKPK